MWLTEASGYLISNANEICFTLAMVISAVFYRQYRRYEQQVEREEMIGRFLN